MPPKPVNYIGRSYDTEMYGTYRVIEDLGMSHVTKSGRPTRLLRIRFDDSGYETDVVPACLGGAVKDPTVGKICGVGYFGSPIGYDPNNIKHTRTYTCFSNMIHRCYDPNDKMYPSYGALGIYVCDRWLCFANFFEDIQKMENYDKAFDGKRSYELDKDTYFLDHPDEFKYYSPETCSIISKSTNLAFKQFDNPNKEVPYVGVGNYNNNLYRSKLYVNGSKSSVINGIFTNPKSAAIYRDSIAKYTYGLDTVNGLDLSAESFMNACKDRVYDGKSYPYKQLITPVDNIKPRQLYKLINKEDKK